MNVYSQISRNKLRSYLVIALFIGLISLVFYLLGQYVGNPVVYFGIGIAFSLISAVGSYYYSDKIVLKMANARPANKEQYFDYYTVAENLAIAAGIPMPDLYVIDDAAPNAFATGRNPEHAVVAATTGLLKKLDRSELEGVIAHEMSHIKNYDILVMTIVTVLVGTIVYAIDIAYRMMWFRGSDDNRSGAIGAIILVLLLIFMPIIASLIQMTVSRKREFMADASGVLLTRNPDGLADALEKISSDKHVLRSASNATAHMYISNPFKKDSKTRNFIAKLFMTHPPAEERIKILRQMQHGS